MQAGQEGGIKLTRGFDSDRIFPISVRPVRYCHTATAKKTSPIAVEPIPNCQYPAMNSDTAAETNSVAAEPVKVVKFPAVDMASNSVSSTW